MNDVFISYKREDEARVAPIVEGLRGAGLSVWWDRDIAGGTSWRQSISEQLAGARCAVVVWSEISVSPLGEFVHDEAGRAKARGVLVPVRLDRVAEPVGFGEIQSIDLSEWRGNPRDPQFQTLVATVKAVVAGGPRPRPIRPGRRARLVAAWISGLGLAATIFGVAANVVGLQKQICRIPGVHRVCAAYGLGGVPTPAEDALWAKRIPGDCNGLRTYLASFPQGAYAEEADRRLKGAEPIEEVHWIPEEQRPMLFVSKALAPLASEEAARADALQRAVAAADLACDGYRQGEFRLVSSAPKVKEWHCSARGSGFACSFEGHAICQVEARHVTQRQVCN